MSLFTNSIHIPDLESSLDRGAYVNWKGCEPYDDPDIDIDRHIPCSKTPLHFASSLGHVDATKLLLSYGADVNNEDEDRSRPLEIDLLGSHTEVAQLLLERCATVEREDAYAGDSRSPEKLRLPPVHTALYYATFYNNVGMIKKPISKGALVNGVKLGSPPLFVARSSEAARLLVKAGAGVNPIFFFYLVWETPMTHLKLIMQIRGVFPN